MSDEREIAAEDHMRAHVYRLLAAFLASPPREDLLKRAASLQGDDSGLGQGLAALSKLASRVSVNDAKDEYNKLFIGITRGELLPYASYYLTGFLNERPLAALRDDMYRLGIERAETVSEPEDHIATLCEIMAGLIAGEFGEPASLAEQMAFFDKHLAPWAGLFFSNLEAAQAAVLYAPVGTIGRVFIEIETNAFKMAA